MSKNQKDEIIKSSFIVTTLKVLTNEVSTDSCDTVTVTSRQYYKDSQQQSGLQRKFSVGSTSFWNFVNMTTYPQLRPGLQTSSFAYSRDIKKPSTSGFKYRCSTKKEDEASLTGVEVPLYLCAQYCCCCCCWAEMTERARSWLIYSSHGSSDLAPKQPLGFQTNPKTTSLAPTDLLAKAHLQTANSTSTQEDEQWRLCRHENQSCPDALLGATAQCQLFWRGGESVFLNSKRITDQRKVLGQILLSNVIDESALISPSLHIYHEKFQVTITFYCI